MSSACLGVEIAFCGAWMSAYNTSTAVIPDLIEVLHTSFSVGFSGGVTDGARVTVVSCHVCSGATERLPPRGRGGRLCSSCSSWGLHVAVVVPM